MANKMADINLDEFINSLGELSDWELLEEYNRALNINNNYTIAIVLEIESRGLEFESD
jgi:hypothetical protein